MKPLYEDRRPQSTTRRERSTRVFVRGGEVARLPSWPEGSPTAFPGTNDTCRTIGRPDRAKALAMSGFAGRPRGGSWSQERSAAWGRILCRAGITTGKGACGDCLTRGQTEGYATVCGNAKRDIPSSGTLINDSESVCLAEARWAAIVAAGDDLCMIESSA